MVYYHRKAYSVPAGRAFEAWQWTDGAWPDNEAPPHAGLAREKVVTEYGEWGGVESWKYVHYVLDCRGRKHYPHDGDWIAVDPAGDGSWIVISDEVFQKAYEQV